jgi:hypothetical protein
MALTRSLRRSPTTGYGNTQLVEFFSQMEGVRILTKGGKHLGADGDDFRFHIGSFQLSAYSLQLRVMRDDAGCSASGPFPQETFLQVKDPFHFAGPGRTILFEDRHKVSLASILAHCCPV